MLTSSLLFVDVVDDGAVKAYRAGRNMLTSSLMLLLKLVLSRPTALVRKC